MSEKIVIELSTHSCRDAEEKVREAAKSNDKKMQEVCKRLAELGAEEARRRFARGDHGNGNVDVIPIPMENGYKISASGNDVYFIEFGTGHFAGIGYGDRGVPSGLSVPVYPGSYSEQHSQMFSELGYWFWHGEFLQGTEAEMPMYYAGKTIRANIKKVAEEVFGK